MRFQILSDLHLEFPENRRDFKFQRAPNIDALILAGDIHAHLGIFTLMDELQGFDDVPIYYVPGNHEYYGTSLNEARGERLRIETEVVKRWRNLFVLDDRVVQVNGRSPHLVLGGTLWTDTRDDWFAIQTLRKGMSDYACAIKQGERRLHPTDTDQLHRGTQAFLYYTLRNYPHDLSAVIVTHHLPHPQCVHPKYKNDPLNCGFVSDQSELIDNHPNIKLWVHGHTHDSIDVRVNHTRFVCNPRGYPGYLNPHFDPLFSVTL